MLHVKPLDKLVEANLTFKGQPEERGLEPFPSKNGSPAREVKLKQAAIPPHG